MNELSISKTLRDILSRKVSEIEFLHRGEVALRIHKQKYDR